MRGGAKGNEEGDLDLSSIVQFPTLAILAFGIAHED